MKILELDCNIKNEWDSIPDGLVKVNWSNGNQCWYKDKKFHRVDGPAIIRADYKYFSRYEYRFEGETLTKEKWFSLLTPEQQIKALFNDENW